MSATNNVNPHSQGMAENESLLTKDELAMKLKLKRRGVETLVARRVIPVIRLSGRCVRFSWKAVQQALAKFEIKEVGRK